MNTFAALPSPVRLAVVACCSLLAASFINWAIYSLAWNRRAVGAWSPAPAGSPAHSFADWLPIIGWWRLKRESKTHGNGYWIRPFLIEIIYPLCIFWLYRFEISGGMLPNPAMAMKLGAELHYQFAAHFVLITLMMAATFIDFDEQTIPDEITVFGTLFGLVASTFFAALFPWWLLASANQKPQIVELDAFAPAFRPDWMSGEAGLGVAVTVLTVWALGLWGPIRYFDRRIRNVPKFIAAKLVRDRFLRIVACIWFVATAFVCAVWWLQLNRWGYLYASLMGLACGGGITWALRIIARWTLGVEALGFGDVTLMAMIGTFIGWQPSLLVFFVAPPMMAVLIFGESKSSLVAMRVRTVPISVRAVFV
ncbi:MAG: prepilin peptidase [Pirellulales bacterium]